jgi:4-hydroxy-2-oxoheptanedioate aldolase
MKWIRRKALAREVCSGAWLNLGSSVTAGIAGRAGYDWVLIDLEHGSGNFGDLLHQLDALEAHPPAVIVRMPCIDMSIFKQVLDLGPAGVMVPQVSNAAEAATLVDMLRIPPLGRRGAATTTRASQYGFGYRRYLEEANQNLLGVAQIESLEAIENIGEIAAVDGIDVLFVGPGDLGTDLELRGRAADFDRLVERVVACARDNGKAAGVLVRNEQEARKYLRMGFTFIALGTDRGMVVKGMIDGASFFRDVRMRQASPDIAIPEIAPAAPG